MERAVAVVSLAVLAASVAWLRPGEALAGSVVIAALAWGIAPFVIDALIASRARPTVDLPDASATVTTIVCVRDEPPDVASASIILAAASGPVFVATTDPSAEAANVPVFTAATIDAALSDAIGAVETHGVYIVSASTFPTTSAAHAAALLDGTVAWVVGRAAAFTRDAFFPGEHDDHAVRLRARARAGGLTIWEPDATVVRADALRALDTTAGPRGSWLRALAAQGYEGLECDAVVARRAAPTDGPQFWPSEVMRARGLTADHAAALRTGPLGSRLLAAGGLLRQLNAYRFAALLCVPLAVAWAGRFPFAVSPIAFLTLHASLAAARWNTERRATGSPRHPVRDTLATIYRAPASFLSITSAFTRRIRPPRFGVIDQPLLVSAIAITCGLGASLFDRPPSADAGTDAVVALTVAAVALLWMCAVHAVGPRAWTRKSYRLAVDGKITVGRQTGRVCDASPSGLAAVGSFDELDEGAHVDVDVRFEPTHETVSLTATVAALRPALAGQYPAGQHVVGLSLDASSPSRAAWVRALFRAARLLDDGAAPDPARTPEAVEVSRRTPVRRTVLRGEAVAVGALSIAVLGAVVLVTLGYRPLVVRSASMSPALDVGDVAITDWYHASDIATGDIVTLDRAPDADTITHRVRSVEHRDRLVVVETRGDANETSERWELADDEIVGRVVGRVPAVGRVIAQLGRIKLVLIGAGASLAAATFVVGRPRRTLRSA